MLNCLKVVDDGAKSREIFGPDEAVSTETRDEEALPSVVEQMLTKEALAI